MNNPNIGAALLAEAMDDIMTMFTNCQHANRKAYQDLIHQRLSEYRRSSGTVGVLSEITVPAHPLLLYNVCIVYFIDYRGLINEKL